MHGAVNFDFQNRLPCPTQLILCTINESLIRSNKLLIVAMMFCVNPKICTVLCNCWIIRCQTKSWNNQYCRQTYHCCEWLFCALIFALILQCSSRLISNDAQKSHIGIDLYKKLVKLILWMLFFLLYYIMYKLFFCDYIYFSMSLFV